MISRDEAIQEAGSLHSALHRDLVDHYRHGGARGVAVWVAGEDAPEHELQRLTEQAERWAHRARKRGG